MKLFRLFKAIALLLIPLLGGVLLSCEERDPSAKFWIYNNSSDTIFYTGDYYYKYDYGNDRTAEGFFNAGGYDEPRSYRIAPGDSARHTAYKDFLYRKNYCYYIIIMRKSTLNKYSKNYIIENNIVDTIIDVHYKDLLSSKFKIYYED